jgi:hypothetical protein
MGYYKMDESAPWRPLSVPVTFLPVHQFLINSLLKNVTNALQKVIASNAKSQDTT